MKQRQAEEAGSLISFSILSHLWFIFCDKKKGSCLRQSVNVCNHRKLQIVQPSAKRLKYPPCAGCRMLPGPMFMVRIPSGPTNGKLASPRVL